MSLWDDHSEEMGGELQGRYMLVVLPEPYWRLLDYTCRTRGAVLQDLVSACLVSGVFRHFGHLASETIKDEEP